jgi:hypothetical protein
MRAFVVELAGADDSQVQGILDGLAVAAGPGTRRFPPARVRSSNRIARSPTTRKRASRSSRVAVPVPDACSRIDAGSRITDAGVVSRPRGRPLPGDEARRAWLRIRAVAPHTARPSIGYAPKRIGQSPICRSIISTCAPGTERIERRVDDPRNLRLGWVERRHPIGDGDDRRDVEVADRDPHPVELAEDPHAGRGGIQRDLLSASRSAVSVGPRSVSSAATARKAHLAAVMAVARRPLR